MLARFSLLFLGLAICSTPVYAHDIYSHLVDRNGISCCNDHDCRPAAYRLTPSGVQMRVEGMWIDVPDRKIQYRALIGDTGETAGGHWCGAVYSTFYWFTRCAILPPNSAFAPSGPANEKEAALQ